MQLSRRKELTIVLVLATIILSFVFRELGVIDGSAQLVLVGIASFSLFVVGVGSGGTRF